MLMLEIGALGDLPALQPDHGAEPMHLITSELSGNYFLTWDTSLPFDAALTSMRIEGNLNRFAQVSSWLETNASHGIEPTEELKQELLDYCKDHIAKYAMPREIEFRTELPKTVSGKIQRALL